MADIPPHGWLRAVAGLNEVHLIAGISGGLVRGLVARNMSWWQRLTSAIVGGLTAGYATPAVTPLLRRWLELWSYPAGDLEGSIGFCLGLVGMTICDALIRWARRWRDGPPPFLPPHSGASPP